MPVTIFKQTTQQSVDEALLFLAPGTLEGSLSHLFGLLSFLLPLLLLLLPGQQLLPDLTEELCLVWDDVKVYFEFGEGLGVVKEHPVEDLVVVEAQLFYFLLHDSAVVDITRLLLKRETPGVSEKLKQLRETIEQLFLRYFLLHLYHQPGLLKLALLRVPHHLRPRQTAFQPEKHQVEEGLHVVAAADAFASVVAQTGELQVDGAGFWTADFCDVFKGLSVFVACGCAEVDDEEFVVFLCGAKEQVAGVKLVMDEVFEVEVLQDRNQLLSQHQHTLSAKGTSTRLLQLPHTSVQLLQHDEVIVLFLAAPVHVRYAGSPLHDLEDFSLLQNSQQLLVSPHLVLLALHEDTFGGLRVHSPVKQMLMLPSDLGTEPKTPHQPHFDRTHQIELQLIQDRVMPPKAKKKTKVSLERMLLEPIPETPVPEPYFNIPSPEPYVFPLSSTLLEGVKLIENYFPEDINKKISTKLGGRSIERMSRYKDVYCMMGKGGNGLLVGDQLLNMRGITAFAYGPTHLLIAFDDLRLEIYTMQLRLVKVLKGFSTKRVTFLKLLAVPKGYESMIVLSNVGSKLVISRIEKSFFSTLAVKMSHDVINDLDFPVTAVTEIPAMFRYYLQRDNQYRNCSLLAISAINVVYILLINHAKLDAEVFWKRVYQRKQEDATCSTVSWGQASILAPSRDIKGERLVFNFSFDNKLYFVALKEVEKEVDGQFHTKCEWVESEALELTKRVAFCQQIKKSEVLLITQENTILVFHTRNFDIFEKSLKEEQLEMMSENFPDRLDLRLISGGRKQAEMARNGATEEDLAMLSQGRYISYSDTFLYEYPSNQIYYLTERQFGVYVYCHWRLICDLLKVEQKFECAMIFLIALYKGANRFDLGVAGQEKELGEYAQMLCIDFVNKKLGRMKEMPEIIENLLQQDDYLKLIVTPLQFLVQTDQFDFLFEVVKDKIISCLTSDQSPTALRRSETIFYRVLQKFIEHGRVKYIPETKLDQVLRYFVQADRLDMIDRLAIYFDLTRIDRSVVIQCLLQNNLVVSLAHICTQGNQIEFVTPFVKFWGFSQSHRLKNEPEFAMAYAFRALWYVKLCLQRNWILKEYSFAKYATMITILSQHFLGEKILLSLLSLRPSDCLNTLSYYFTIENSQIINGSDTRLPGAEIVSWIDNREGNEKVEELLSAIFGYLRKALKEHVDERMSLFLSSIIIYKTVRFTEQKYYSILSTLIANYSLCKDVGYGLEDKMLEEFNETFSGLSDQDKDEILAARYINKILTLVYYQYSDFIRRKLPQLYEESRLYPLTDLQAEISFLQGNFSNCIDIYIRSKKAARILLFQFLENSFKRLMLEKRKNEKTALANCIKKEIKYMVKLDSGKIKVLVQNYVPEIQEQLIAALGDDEQLQLGYLEDIINDSERTQMKSKLSEQSILRFVELMAKHKPDNLIDAFKKNPNFSIEESLKICEQYEVYDCMEYLYERMGSIAESVKIAALRIDRILKTRNDYDEQNFAPYIKIKQILDNAIEVCKKNHSQQIWESLLDSSINLYHKYKDSDLPEDEIEIFFYINGEIMENMASNCTIEHTIELLRTKYTNLNMGGKMTKAFINILSDLSHSINILYIAANLIHLSLQRIQMEDFMQKLHCFHTSSHCANCSYPLTRREKNIHFRCGHAYHQQCSIAKDPVVCVACLDDRSDQFTYYLNTLNPRFPKMKKVKELLGHYEQKKLEMGEVFKVQEFERVERREDDGFKEARHEKRKNKFQRFDDSVKDIEEGNWRVLNQLGYYN